MTNADIAAGQAALEAYVEGVTWKAMFIKAAVYHEGAIDAIRAADVSPDQTPQGRQAAATAALARALAKAGYASQVTPQQLHDGTAVILAAVNKARA